METLAVPARDGYALGATLFAPEGEPRAVALIHPATAVPQKIYAGFALARGGRPIGSKGSLTKRITDVYLGF
jgi:predicted alpha/beta hydrolase